MFLVLLTSLCLQACFGDVTQLPRNYLVTPQKTASKKIPLSDNTNNGNNVNDPFQGFGYYPGSAISLPYGYNGIDEYSNFPYGFNTNNLDRSLGIPSLQYQAFPPNYETPQYSQEILQYPPQFFPNNGVGFTNLPPPQIPYELQQQGFGEGGNFPQPNLPQQNFPSQFLQQFPSQQGFALNGNQQQLLPSGYGNFQQAFDTKPSLRIASDTAYDTNGGYLYNKN